MWQETFFLYSKLKIILKKVIGSFASGAPLAADEETGFTMIIWHPFHDEPPTTVLEGDEALIFFFMEDQNGCQCCCLRDE